MLSSADKTLDFREIPEGCWLNKAWANKKNTQCLSFSMMASDPPLFYVHPPFRDWKPQIPWEKREKQPKRGISRGRPGGYPGGHPGPETFTPSLGAQENISSKTKGPGEHGAAGYCPKSFS